MLQKKKKRKKIILGKWAWRGCGSFWGELGAVIIVSIVGLYQGILVRLPGRLMAVIVFELLREARVEIVRELVACRVA